MKYSLHPHVCQRSAAVPSCRTCQIELLASDCDQILKAAKEEELFFKHSCSLILCVRMIDIFGQMSDYLSNSWRKHTRDKDIL